MNVTWTGVAEMRQAFERLAEATRSEILSSTAIAGALPIENRAKELCPVRTGTLRRSIETRFGESSATKATALVGSAIDYAPYVEFGTSRMAARAFLRPAFDEMREDAKKEMSQTFSELVREEIGNIGPRGGAITT